MAHRTPYVGGNWKMHNTRAAAKTLAADVAAGLKNAPQGVDIAVFPPFVHLQTVSKQLAGTAVAMGAQDIYPEAQGAFTGEISAAMLQDIGATQVLVGHSERRHVIGEDDALLARKTTAAIAAGLTCVLCVGETKEQRQAGQTDAVNEQQLRSALANVAASDAERLIIAYEPVWAIGTGETATPADAQNAHATIRGVLVDVLGAAVAGTVRVIYGGSVKPANAVELFSQPDIDGGLIGGASLKSDAFLEICTAATPAGAERTS